MKKTGVAILGLGTVGGGVYKILTEKKEFFKKTQGLDVTVEGVLNRTKAKAEKLGIDSSVVADSIEEIISNPSVDIVVEAIGGVEPARTYVLKALLSGKTVVTSNKELLAKCGQELETEAKKMNVGLFYEASCVGGVPVIRVLQDGMQANEISSIKGIINGTTNYILTEMSEKGSSYEAALKAAQELGFAEANPAADVEGFDAAYKLAILSGLAFGSRVGYTNVYREGITGIKKEDIAYGKDMGYTLKLLAIGKKQGDCIDARVHPSFIKSDNPLASVGGSFNAVQINGDSVGEIMLYGRGAGEFPTASAVVSDVIFAAKHDDGFCYSRNDADCVAEAKYISDFETEYYLRICVKDESGVMAKIASVFAKSGISFKEITQMPSESGRAEIIMITHRCKESVMSKSLEKISTIEEVFGTESRIRIEE